MNNNEALEHYNKVLKEAEKKTGHRLVAVVQPYMEDGLTKHRAILGPIEIKEDDKDKTLPKER